MQVQTSKLPSTRSKKTVEVAPLTHGAESMNQEVPVLIITNAGKSHCKNYQKKCKFQLLLDFGMPDTGSDTGHITDNLRPQIIHFG
jgi:hypothetical protein